MQKVDEKKVKEAIEFLQRKIRTLDAQKEYDEYCNPVHNETLDLAIGLYETAIKALEKQLPKEIKAINPERSEESGDVEFCCPNCNSHYLYDITDVPNYCPECGIRFDT